MISINFILGLHFRYGKVRVLADERYVSNSASSTPSLLQNLKSNFLTFQTHINVPSESSADFDEAGAKIAKCGQTTNMNSSSYQNVETMV